jgi:hypothetical protein
MVLPGLSPERGFWAISGIRLSEIETEEDTQEDTQEEGAAGTS